MNPNFLKLMLIALLSSAVCLFGQDSDGTASVPPNNGSSPPNQDVSTQPRTTGPSIVPDEYTIEASETSQGPQRQLVSWNHYEGKYITFKFGAGFLLDANSYVQDDTSKQQIKMKPDFKLRDFRLITGGKFPQLKRDVTWCFGAMYDQPNDHWLIRKSGIQIAVPEAWGYFFIGRDKEGFSLNKVMVGYDGWTMERSSMSDATIPILADGFRWVGYTPKHHFLWNAGYFNDIFSKKQSFSTYSSQAVGRFIWLPIHSEEQGTLVHVGPNLRWGRPEDNQIQFKARPESWGAPNFIDTGKFPAQSTRMIGPELYVRDKSFLFGTEYWWVFVQSRQQNDPVFNGGDVVATYVLTGEIRPYNAVGGYFRDISPRKTVFSGGKGAWELVLRYSYADFNNKNIHGGTFQRITPQVNWYLSDNVRLEANYGYGHLDRFDLAGNTQFFQSRIQLQF